LLIADKHIRIVADYREVPSAIPDMLKQKGVTVELKNLKTGDYLINNTVLVERKSRDDFIISIIQDRLFDQCSRLRKSKMHSILLIEGNPYHSNHNIDRNAVKGALLSVSLSWQIPIVYTSGHDDTASVLIMSANQLLRNNLHFLQRAGKPKRAKGQALYFLQGLPSVGQKTAKALLERFRTPENVVLATEDELLEVEGLGKEKVKKIRAFLRQKTGGVAKR
jgi:Fanconi anemia group M protein